MHIALGSAASSAAANGERGAGGPAPNGRSPVGGAEPARPALANPTPNSPPPGSRAPMTPRKVRSPARGRSAVRPCRLPGRRRRGPRTGRHRRVPTGRPPHRHGCSPGRAPAASPQPARSRASRPRSRRARPATGGVRGDGVGDRVGADEQRSPGGQVVGKRQTGIDEELRRRMAGHRHRVELFCGGGEVGSRVQAGSSRDGGQHGEPAGAGECFGDRELRVEQCGTGRGGDRPSCGPRTISPGTAAGRLGRGLCGGHVVDRGGEHHHDVQRADPAGQGGRRPRRARRTDLRSGPSAARRPESQWRRRPPAPWGGRRSAARRPVRRSTATWAPANAAEGSSAAVSAATRDCRSCRSTTAGRSRERTHPWPTGRLVQQQHRDAVPDREDPTAFGAGQRRRRRIARRSGRQRRVVLGRAGQHFQQHRIKAATGGLSCGVVIGRQSSSFERQIVSGSCIGSGADQGQDLVPQRRHPVAVRRLDVQPQQRLGVAGPHVEPPLPSGRVTVTPSSSSISASFSCGPGSDRHRASRPRRRPSS